MWVSGLPGRFEPEPLVSGPLQYMVPAGQFILAVFVFGEPFTSGTLVTFGCIWAALAVYSFDTVRREMSR